MEHQAKCIIFIVLALSANICFSNPVSEVPPEESPSGALTPRGIEIECLSPGKFEALACNQYYECRRGLWALEKTLKTCPAGYAFDPIKENCELSSSCVSDVPPYCTRSGKYPAPSKNQYYECKFAWFKWRSYLVTCPLGHVFDSTLKNCVRSP